MRERTVETIRPNVNTPGQVLFASLIGTTIEFFDFYIYATAAVLVFPRLFFPTSDPASAVLASLATFGIAFVARPIGSALFGHFGDRIGRKATLVAALLTMGVSTVTIGILPTYETIGIAAPRCSRCAASVRVSASAASGAAPFSWRSRMRRPESARGTGCFRSSERRSGSSFPAASFLALSQWLTNDQFLAFGWRIPFLASAALVAVGLYIRLTITETPVFQQAAMREERAKVPMLTVIRDHPRTLVLGTLAVDRDVRPVLPDDGLLACRGAPPCSATAATRSSSFNSSASCSLRLTIPIGALIAERGAPRHPDLGDCRRSASSGW